MENRHGLDHQARSDERRNSRFETMGPGEPADCGTKLAEGIADQPGVDPAGGSAPGPPSIMTRHCPDVTSNPAGR